MDTPTPDRPGSGHSETWVRVVIAVLAGVTAALVVAVVAAFCLAP
ncbi:hypothetical protein ABZW49_10780 [Nonomuraea wenchangensis]